MDRQAIVTQTFASKESGSPVTTELVCSSTGERSYAWWQKGIIYQIYPLLFQDIDGKGKGDLSGILSRLLLKMARY